MTIPEKAAAGAGPRGRLWLPHAVVPRWSLARWTAHYGASHVSRCGGPQTAGKIRKNMRKMPISRHHRLFQPPITLLEGTPSAG